MTNKCQFRKKDGTICDANALLGQDVCVFHDSTKEEEGRRARRAGGLARSKPAVLPPDAPDVHLGTYKDVANLLGESISQVRRGELDPRVANAVGYLSGILIRALEQGVMEQRLCKIEAALGLDESSEKERAKNEGNPQAN
jgi:hypothetical protein